MVQDRTSQPSSLCAGILRPDPAPAQRGKEKARLRELGFFVTGAGGLSVKTDQTVAFRQLMRLQTKLARDAFKHRPGRENFSDDGPLGNVGRRCVFC